MPRRHALQSAALRFFPCSVVQLHVRLKALGYTVFLGESDLEGGQSWHNQIVKAIL
jgi:hypothetical protein